MSWFSKVSFFSALCLVSASASAQRIYFSTADAKAGLETRVFATNSRSVAGVEVQLSLPYLDLNRVSDGFSEVSAPGLVPMEQPGNPALYTTGSLIAVPEGFEPVIDGIDSQQEEIHNVLIKPAQRQLRCEGNQDNFQFNSALYDSNGVFPAQNVGLEEVGRLQGLRLVRVSINPLQMDMATKTLKVTTSASVRVNFRQTTREIRPVVLSKTFYQIARNVTANGRHLGRDVMRADVAEKMLIVVADGLKDTIAPLVNWKQAKGINVDVVTFTDAGGSKEKVKEYIQKYYDSSTPKLTYLVMVGNGKMLPPYMENTGSGDAATDYTFALLSGNDVIPDVLYGRVVADNADEVATQINRWIAYERTPEKGAGWYHDGSTIASNEGSGPSDKEYAQKIQAALKANTYKTVDEFYQGNKTATSKNITAALESGRTWLSYFGHGSGTSWGSVTDNFSNTTVSKLKNEDKLPVIIDVACLNAAFTDIAKPFGKAWVTQQSNGKAAGAVAFYGGSVSISWHPPAIMSVGISKYHFEKPVHNLGGSVLAGQLYLIEQKGNNDDTVDNLKWYNLFGDPSLLVRTDTPVAYQVKNLVKKTDRGLSIDIAALDSAGKPVKGLRASIRKANAPMAVATTDASGNATLTVDGLSSFEANTTLVTTGYNAETIETVLQ